MLSANPRSVRGVSLTLHEARARAALLADVSYDVALDLTDRETFGVRARITFTCAEPGASTFLELHDGHDVRVDGAAAEYADGRIPLRDLAATNEVVVEARLPYVTDGEGMHTFTDPADGEVYASAYVGMDLAHRVFPCFDQNDLKAPITLRVTAPPHWTVLANGRATRPGGDGRWEFATTPPIPPAMFVVCGGPWVSVTWEHAGLGFGWHARASLAAALERDAADLRRVTETCFDHYARIFDEPYPFDSYDQVMAPGQNWGAVETPGCITYRDEMLPLSTPTEPERRVRSMVIAHEMAHMWFGDLVTMTWWEDTWLQESFADYLGYRVAEEAAGIEGAIVDFTIARKPEAYAADERRSTHPVAPRAEDVPDVDAASTNFDALSYAKGNSALRQLVTWIGDDAFFAGVNAYLSQHRWGNATLDDFVAALDAASDRDVRGWVEGWLRRTGFDTLRVRRDDSGPVLVRDGSRAHRLRVATYDASFRSLGSTFVDVGDEPVRLPDAPVVVPNAAGETYARVRLDERSWAAVAAGLSSVPEPTTRALLWTTAFDLVWTGELGAAEFLDLVGRHLPAEPVSSIAAGVLRWSRDRLVRLLRAGRGRDGGPGVPGRDHRGGGRRDHRRCAGDGADALPGRRDHRRRPAAGLARHGRPDAALAGGAPARLPGRARRRGHRGAARRRRHHRGGPRRSPRAGRGPDRGGEGGRVGTAHARRAPVQPRVRGGGGRSLGRRAGRPGRRLRRPVRRRGAAARRRARADLRRPARGRVPGRGAHRGAGRDARGGARRARCRRCSGGRGRTASTTPAGGSRPARRARRTSS